MARRKRGVGSQAREYRKAQRLETKKKRIDDRQAVKRARTEKQRAIKEARISKRGNIAQTRMAVKSAKQLEKIYGDLDKNEVNSINAFKPFLPMMQKDLEDKGIPFDETDPIETINKYAEQEPMLDLPYEEDVYNDAFINDEADYDTSIEYFLNVDKAKKSVASAVPYILGGLGGMLDVAKDKRQQKVPLTETEVKILKVNDEVEKQVKNKVVSTIGDKTKDFLPIIVIILILILVFKK